MKIHLYPIRKTHNTRFSGIYRISNSINNKIYIGSSKNVFERIFKEHINLLKNNKHHSFILQNHVNKYGIDSLLFSEIEGVYKRLDENIEEFKVRLLEREQYYIDKFKLFSKKGIPMGFNISPKASSNIGFKLDESKKYKIYSPVDQYDLNGNYIQTFKSITEAEKYVKTTKSNIVGCIKRNHVKSAGGFLWIYKGQSIQPILNKFRGKKKAGRSYKKIQQYDMNGNYITTYFSIHEAEKQTHTKHISQYINNKRKKAGNFIWKYIEE